VLCSLSEVTRGVQSLQHTYNRLSQLSLGHICIIILAAKLCEMPQAKLAADLVQ
jgi:hypothetical protein